MDIACGQEIKKPEDPRFLKLYSTQGRTIAQVYSDHLNEHIFSSTTTTHISHQS